MENSAPSLKIFRFVKLIVEIKIGGKTRFENLLKQLPCIRLAHGKFELTNQDSVGGKNSSVLSDALESGNFSHWRWH